MESKQLAIQVQPRIVARKSDLKKLRKQNFVPGIVYGSKQKNIPLFLDIRAIEKYSKREYENAIFTLQSDDKSLDGLSVIKKAVSFHPTKRKPIHIDFLSLDMSTAIKVNVEVRFEGKSKGVREQGGIFNAILRNVELECLPSNIPAYISVDINALELNQILHVSDLNIPNDSKLITKTTQTLCAVIEMQKEEVVAPVVSAEGTTTETGATPAETTPEDKAGKKPSDSK